jgi:integrase
MFPSHRVDGAATSFRKQLQRVKKETNIHDVTFQYFRHYFISHGVMSGVDYVTIAKWVGHWDSIAGSSTFEATTEQRSIDGE